MTISAVNASSGPYTANGATTAFPYTFAALSSDEVKVAIDGVPVSPSLYTVTRNAGDEGGTVTFLVAPANGGEVIPFLDPDFTQGISFTNAGPFLASSHDEALDRAAVRDIALKAQTDRGGLPAYVERAGKFPVFDAGGNLTTSEGTGTDAGLRTDLAASGGAALAGFIDDGIGAAPTSLQTALRRINQKPSGQFYSEYGAKIQRFADRVFGGDAVKNLGSNVTSQSDWLTTFQLARGRANGLIQSSQWAVTTGTETTSGGLAIVGAAKNGSLGLNYNAVGLTGIGVSDNGGVGTGMAWGGYFEGFRYGASSRGAYGVEADVINFVAAVAIDPFTQDNNQTVGCQVASGGEFVSGLFSASAAYAIRKNGADFLSGIIFGSDAIKLTGGIGEAIAFAIGHKVQWYGAAGVKTSGVLSTGTTLAGGTNLVFAEGLTQFQNATSGKIQLQLVSGASRVNFFNVVPSATGAPVQLGAAGDDANVGIQWIPKGSEYVWFGTWTANADAAVNGYITIKDASGNLRKLATIA